MDTHETWMAMAFKEAEKAYAKNEIPVGAVIVLENRIIG
ncbi:MAG TPA: tRNA-specific adenosine deaminase, partial [bacterium]|nr:tRNA-specific adenosine deaminase [bacterium]